MGKTTINISSSDRINITEILNNRLAESVDLYLQVKQCHWSVTGNNFVQLHELFDEIAETVLQATDLIAERIQQLGGQSHGTVRVVATTSSLPPFPDDIACPVHGVIRKRHPANNNLESYVMDTDDLIVSFNMGENKNDKECPPGNCMQYIKLLINIVGLFGNKIRKDIKNTADLEDFVTSDILTEITRNLDKHTWQLEAHIQNNT